MFENYNVKIKACKYGESQLFINGSVSLLNSYVCVIIDFGLNQTANMLEYQDA